MADRMPLSRNESGDRFEVNDGEFARFDGVEKVWYGDPGGPGGAITPLSLTYYVDVDRAETSPDGSIAKPFPTIQEAIDAGATTIMVVQGSYSETLVPPAALNLIGLPGNGENAPAFIDAITMGDANVLYVEGLNIGNVSVPGVISVNLRAERCTFATIEADSGGSIALEAETCIFVGTVDCGAGSATLSRSIVQTDVSGATLRLFSCELADVFGGDVICRLCNWTSESDLQQNGVSGGGAPHANPAWRFIACSFLQSAVHLLSQGGGESFSVYMDDQSWGSFWATGSTQTGATFYQDSAILPITIYAADATMTVDSSAGATYKAITAGGSGFGGGGSPWSAPTDVGLTTYLADYLGVGSPPPTPPGFCLVRIIATVQTTIGGNVGLGVSVDGDVIGGALTNRNLNEQVTRAPATIPTQISCERLVDLPLAGATTIQPAFACDSGDDLTILSCTQTIIPQPLNPGY